MRKNVGKFGAGVLGLVAVGAALFYGVSWYQERKSPEYALKQKYEKLMEQYRSDTYGGDTPEETLRLFIDALKAGDTDLAAKYFVVEEREKQVAKLSEIRVSGVINFMIEDLEKLKLTKQDVDRAFFTLADSQKKVLVEMILIKNSNNKWKILEL